MKMIARIIASTMTLTTFLLEVVGMLDALHLSQLTILPVQVVIVLCHDLSDFGVGQTATSNGLGPAAIEVRDLVGTHG